MCWAVSRMKGERTSMALSASPRATPPAWRLAWATVNANGVNWHMIEGSGANGPRHRHEGDARRDDGVGVRSLTKGAQNSSDLQGRALREKWFLEEQSPQVRE